MQTPTQSPPDITASDGGLLASGSNIDMIARSLTRSELMPMAYWRRRPCYRARKLALLVEALSAACDEYVLLYERIYDDSQAAQQNSCPATQGSTSLQAERSPD